MTQPNAAEDSASSFDIELSACADLSLAPTQQEFVRCDMPDAGEVERAAQPAGEDYDSCRDAAGDADSTELGPIVEVGHHPVLLEAVEDRTAVPSTGISDPIMPPGVVDTFNLPTITGRPPIGIRRTILDSVARARSVNWRQIVYQRETVSAESYPWFASFALAAMIGIELVRIFSMVVQTGPIQSVGTRAVRPVATGSMSVDVSRILTAHLFGMAEAGPQDASTAASTTTTQLTLLGTIATEDPRRGVAIVSDGEKSKVYVVGQDMGPATLHSVYLSRVVIDHQGILETLSLPLRQTAHGSAAIASNEAESTSSPFQNAPPQSFHGGFNSLARMDAVNDGGTGKLRGFRLYPGNDTAAFQNAGLQSGDLVVAVNGSPLVDAQRSLELWNNANSAAGVRLTIERDGRMQRLGVDLTQFAKAAGVDLAEGTGTIQNAQPTGGPQTAGVNPAAVD